LLQHARQHFRNNQRRNALESVLFPGSSEKHALKAPLVVAEVHDRMPVVLESKDFASWLNDGGPSLLKPAANDVLQR
jgi:hypothetical protein